MQPAMNPIPSPSSLPTGISVVVPVYNSAGHLAELMARLSKTLEKIAKDYEIIFVNDGSQDESWAVIERLMEEYPRLRGLNLMRNYGQHNALLCGVRFARYDTTITLDDDLQHPPEEMEKLLPPLSQGFDVVYGTPIHQQHGFWRNLASSFIKLALQTTMGVENARKVSAFRAFRTSLREAFAHYRSPFVILDVLLSWGTNRFTTVPVDHHARQEGRSNYTFSTLLIHAINMVTGFTVLPLQLASLMGFTFGLFGLIVLAYVIGKYLLLGGSVPGFPFLASIIAIFSGVQLFSLGIIGEYLARIHFRTMEKPPYVVRQAVNLPDKGAHDEQ